MPKIIRYSLLFLFVLFLLLVLERTTLPETTGEMYDRAEYFALGENGTLPPQPFVYDGCSLWPDLILGHDLAAACLDHDISYWIGGNGQEKEMVDRALREDIAETGPLGSVIGWVMYIGVALFGDSALAKAFDINWGFGWNE